MRRKRADWATEFLPDADALERRQLPTGFTATLYTLVALCVGAVIWASLCELDVVVTARGRLVTQQPNIVVQAFETAQISSLGVSAGQIVRKGQVLAVLDPTFVTADLSQARARLASLDAELRRLAQEREGAAYGRVAGGGDEALQSRLQVDRKASYQARLARLDENIGRMVAGLATNEAEIRVLESRMKSLREIEAMHEALTAQNFQSRLKLLESRERRQEVEREQQNAANRTSELKRQLAEARAERLAFVQEWRQKSTEDEVNVRRERDGVAEQVSKAARRSQLISLIAPADAVVQEVAAKSAGSVVRESEQLFVLVPLNVPLEAEIRVDSADIGYVKLSDPVRLKVDAFPFQKHGAVTGRLDKLGQDAFTRDTGAGAGQAAYYVAHSRVDPSGLHALPRQAQLVPGMSLTAEIVVGRRTVMSYVMYPVLGALSSAVREP